MRKDMARNNPEQAATMDDSFASPTKKLATLIDAIVSNPPKLARSDKKGKFPIAAMRSMDGGKTLDMFPLTVAMDEISFEQIRDLIYAAIECRPLLGDGDAKLSSTKDERPELAPTAGGRPTTTKEK